MAGSSEDARFAVFDFEEDLFLEPFDLFDEADIELLRAQAQQNALLQESAPACAEMEVPREGAVLATASTSAMAATMPTTTTDEPSFDRTSETAATEELAPHVVDKLRHCVHAATSKVEQLQREVLQATRAHSILKRTKQLDIIRLKDRDAGSGGSSVNKKPRLFDAARIEAVKKKKMSDLMRLGGTLLRQLMQHRWAWPFLQPVDVEGLQLHDYYKIIKRPMDLGTIRGRLEAKDGTGYRHIRELCEDVRLVFRNAMLYNESWTEVHVMAKALLHKFEDRWKVSIEPRLIELYEDQHEGYLLDIAELRSQEEQAAEQLSNDVLSELSDMESKLNSLVMQVLSKCRPMKVEEKNDLYSRLQKLPPPSLSRVVEIVSPESAGDAVDDISVDLEALDPSTLWRLHFFEKMITDNAQEQVEAKSQVNGPRQAV
ncbi:hypothetical protein L7F22_004184 [Adiantum nelumboides]|nr:hypothetical protein [Adiantum nelumboides]